MEPLSITARLRGGIALPHGPLALDALLAWRVSQDLVLAPPRSADECERIDIPIQLEPGGRFHLCSFSESTADAHEVRYINRRAPLEQYQLRGNANVRRVQITAGPDKSYRIPLEVQYVVGDSLRWWCVGDADAISALLSRVPYLGKKRSIGLGRVAGWDVSPCEPWGDGFPVARNGDPLRPLPLDWPGLGSNPAQAFRTLTYPYWDHAKEELCAAPAGA